MNPKRLASALVALVALTLFPTMACAQGSAEPDAGGPSPGSEKPLSKPRARWQKPLKLPDQYRSKDKDNDGQIGMYEWDKRDYATFRKLDINHDGFLTVEELTRGAPSKSVKPSTTIAATESASKPVRLASPPGSTAGSETLDASPAVAATSDTAADRSASPSGEDNATTSAAASTPGRSEAERQWEIVDKDKDGKVSESEWGRSYLARPKFRDAGIAVTFPLGKDEFLQLYSQLPGAGK